MRHASVFSGIGGPEVAAAMLGWENLFHCEINPFGRAVLGYWFPNTVSYEDITKTDFTPWRGKVDILTGGFPCQPFSYAGKRKGRDDERYLWPHMHRVINEIRPTWVVCENVGGITTMVEGGVLSDMGGYPALFQEGDLLHGFQLEETFTIERICEDLEADGYSVQTVLVPAAAVGAPHRRDRVFIVAHRKSDDSDERISVGEIQGEQEPQSLGSCPRIQHGERSDHARVATNTADLGLQRAAQQGAEEDICGETGGKRHQTQRVVSTPTNGIRRIIAHTNGPGREEPQFPGRGEDCPEEGAGLHDRAERSGSDGYPSYAEGEQHDGLRLDESEDGRREGRAIGRSDRFTDSFLLLPENRWREFPTFSPIHRGNDGLPFDVDDLTISFTKWRTESLKAYGNAIVPQVMYRIFQAIEQATHEKDNVQ